MITGVLLILAGILIAVYPPLLSLIVAAFLILLGILVLLAARDYRRNRGERRARVVELLFRR